MCESSEKPKPRRGKKRRRLSKRTLDQRRFDSEKPARVGPATDALPGTEEKLRVLEGRYARREELFVPRDMKEDETRTLDWVPAAGNNHLMPGGERKVDPDSCDVRTSVRGDCPSDRVLEARMRAGVGMRELARMAGVSEAQVRHAEDRTRTPSLYVLWRVALALGVSLSWLACLEAMT